MWKKIAALMLTLILVASLCSVASAETTPLSGKLTIWAWGADAEAEQRKAIGTEREHAVDGLGDADVVQRR